MAAAAAAAAAARRLRVIGSFPVDNKSAMFRRVETTKCNLTNSPPASSRTKLAGRKMNCQPISPFNKFQLTGRSSCISELFVKMNYQPISLFNKFQFSWRIASRLFPRHHMKTLFSQAALGVRDAIVDMLTMLYEWLESKVIDYYMQTVGTMIAAVVAYEVLPTFGIHIDIKAWINQIGASNELGAVLKEAKDLLEVLYEEKKAMDELRQEVHKIREGQVGHEQRIKKMEETLAKLHEKENHILKELEVRIKVLEDAQTKTPKAEPEEVSPGGASCAGT